MTASRELRTSHAELRWNEDGTTIAKRLVRASDGTLLWTDARRFRNEGRINRLLLAAPPPVPTPALLDADRRGGSLTFAAVAGAPLGPKYPELLSHDELSDLIGLTCALRPYNPHRRWLRRFAAGRRLRTHVAEGDLTAAQAAHVRRRTEGVALCFAHGDVTARNVIAGPDGLVLIDWEWAGVFPAGWDLAVLWFTLAHAPGGRDAVVAAMPAALCASFWVSVTYVHLLHLHLWHRTGAPFIERHRATLAGVLDRL